MRSGQVIIGLLLPSRLGLSPAQHQVYLLLNPVQGFLKRLLMTIHIRHVRESLRVGLLRIIDPLRQPPIMTPYGRVQRDRGPGEVLGRLMYLIKRYFHEGLILRTLPIGFKEILSVASHQLMEGGLLSAD